jgi:HSP20 family protein
MTNLTRWNPFEEIGRWPRSLLSRDLFNALQSANPLGTEWSPSCDVTETDGEIVVHAEIPGVDAKDIDVSVKEGALTIRGEKRSEKTSEEEGRKYTERFFGSFERTIPIPPNVDLDQIDANLKDGVLELRVPKVPVVEPESKKVQIKSAEQTPGQG